MNSFENSLLAFPKFVQSTINKRCQIISPAFSGSIFEPKICLESLESAISRYIFSIYFKHKVADVMDDATQIMKPQKTLVEQIELLIEEDETKAKMAEKDALDKLESLKKSIQDLILNSPLFSFIKQKESPYITLSNFEANCSQNEEASVKSSLDATWLPAISIGPYTITVGLFSLHSKDISSLINDHLLAFVSRFLKSAIIITDKNQKEGALSDDSWELLGDEEEEEKKIEEEKNDVKDVKEEPLKVEQSQIPQENKSVAIDNNSQEEEKVNQSLQKSKAEQNNPIEVSEKEKEKIKLIQNNKEMFVETLLEYTEQLKKLSDKKFKRQEESCEGLLNRENNFLYTLMSNNPA
jgi:hypothetical protein